MSSFGDSIRSGREVAGLSQAKVAELIGKSPSTVRAWEMGRTNPSEPSSVRALAAVLGLDEPTLLDRAGFERQSSAPKPRLRDELETLRESDATPIPPPPAETPETLPEETAGGKPRPVAPRHARAAPEQPPAEEPTPATRGPEIPITVVERTAEPRPVKVTKVRPAPIWAARSYVEEEDQRQLYRWRGIVTAVCLFVLFLAFWWALRNMGGAISEFVGGFVDSLNI